MIDYQFGPGTTTLRRKRMLSGTRDSRSMKVAMLFHPLALSTLFMVLIRDWNIQTQTRFSLEALICRPGGCSSPQRTQRLIRPSCPRMTSTLSLSRHTPKIPHPHLTRFPYQTTTVPFHHQNSHRMANPPPSLEPWSLPANPVNSASSSYVIPTP